MGHSLHFIQVLTAILFKFSFTSAHLAAYTDGMYCPENSYKGPLTNFTDPNHVVFDPLYELEFDSWFLSKGRNCLLAEPTGVWEIEANTEIAVPWANWQNSTGYYADGKEYDERPIPYSVTNPQVVADGLVTSSGGLSSPNMHAGNKSTAAGTAIAIAYVSNVYDVTMENLVVVSTAPETPFERLCNYTIPDLAPCDECICVTGWVPRGYGEQNMYMAAHKCKIVNPNGGSVPKTPSLVPGPGVKGPKQMIAAFQTTGNNVQYKPGDVVPTYSTEMGYMDGAQMDIFDSTANSGTSSASTSTVSSLSTFTTSTHTSVLASPPASTPSGDSSSSASPASVSSVSTFAKLTHTSILASPSATTPSGHSSTSSASPASISSVRSFTTITRSKLPASSPSPAPSSGGGCSF